MENQKQDSCNNPRIKEEFREWLKQEMEKYNYQDDKVYQSAYKSGDPKLLPTHKQQDWYQYKRVMDNPSPMDEYINAIKLQKQVDEKIAQLEEAKEQERILEEEKSINVIWTKDHWKKLIICLPEASQIIVNRWFAFKEDIIFFKYKKDSDSYHCDITFRPSVLEDLVFDELVQKEIKQGKTKRDISNEIDSGLEIIYSLSKKEKEIFAILQEDKLMPETDDETIKRLKRYEEGTKEIRAKIYADQWKDLIVEKLDEHKHALYEETERLSKTDPYGNVENDFYGEDVFDELLSSEIVDEFNEDDGFEEGLSYFWKNVICKDISIEDFLIGWESYRDIYKPKKESGEDVEHWVELLLAWLFQYALHPVAEELDQEEGKRVQAGFEEDMSGDEYEIYCGNLLAEAGWNVEQTSATNDQGVDLIAEIEDAKFCIQCKRYSNAVGNKAVQEVIAGTQFYGGTHSVVVSNAGFTKSAKELAESTGVILINDIDLETLEDFL